MPQPENMSGASSRSATRPARDDGMMPVHSAWPGFEPMLATGRL